MATPSTKATLKTYCLRALGFGVIDINVSDDQVDDRLDEALQYFAQYHYDGIERMYLKHLITSDDVTRARSDASTTATDTIDSSITATWKEGKNYCCSLSGYGKIFYERKNCSYWKSSKNGYY